MNGHLSLEPSPEATGRCSAGRSHPSVAGRGVVLAFALLLTGFLGACATTGTNVRGGTGEIAAESVLPPEGAEGSPSPSSRDAAAFAEALLAQGYDVDPGEVRATDTDGLRAGNGAARRRGDNPRRQKATLRVPSRGNDDGG